MITFVLAWILVSGIVVVAWAMVGGELERRRRARADHERRLQRDLDLLYSRCEEVEL